MKTLLEVKNTYLDTQEEANQVDVEASGGKRLRSRYIKQIQFLYKIIIFLEGNPNAEFLQDQLQTLKNKYNKAMSIKPILDPDSKRISCRNTWKRLMNGKRRMILAS
jgi:hypothetical protein